MKKKSDSTLNNGTLRKKAEKELHSLSKIELKELPAEEAARLIHELRVHQIELEMQNEELRKAHVELQVSRTKYADLYDFAPVGYFTLDTNGLILEANLTGSGLLGSARSNLIKKPFSQFIVKEHQDQFFLHRRKVMDTKERQTCEIRIKKKDRTEFYAQMESIAVKDSHDNFSQCRTILTDISQHKRFLDELIESETRFRTLFEQAAVGVAQIISRTGQFVRINKRYCDIVGYSPDEMEKMTFQELTRPEDLQANLNNMQLLLKGKIPEFAMEKRYVHKNGSIVWVNLTVSPMWRAGETPYYHIAVVEDITARKKAEEELRKAKDELELKVKERTAELTATVTILQKENTKRKEAEEKITKERQKLFTLLEKLPAFVYLQAPDHTIRFANRYFKEQFGDPKGKKCHDILWGRKEPCDVCPTFRVFDIGKPQKWEWNNTPNGQVYEIDDYPFTDIDGTLLVLELGINITERKKAEVQIMEALKEKELLLKEIHHRVKNNMTVISSLLQLQAGKIKDKQYKDMFDDSIDRIRSMARIHEKLYQSRELSKINFGDYIRDMADSMFKSFGFNPRKVNLKKRIEKITLGTDTASPCGLIVNELLSNSLQHAFPEGRSGEIRVVLRINDNDEIELAVGDNGVGMPDDLDIKKTDTLGLNLINALVKQLHGKIDLNREEGTEFRITFRRH